MSELDRVIAQDRESLVSKASIPDAGSIWWKAQLRARRDAVETATQPLTVAQLLAFGCSVGLLGACFGATSEWFQGGLRWARENATALIPSVNALIRGHVFVAISVAAAVVLIPAAMYLTVGRD